MTIKHYNPDYAIHGEVLYSPEVALRLEKALSIAVRIWMKLVELYRHHHACEQ